MWAKYIESFKFFFLVTYHRDTPAYNKIYVSHAWGVEALIKN